MKPTNTQNTARARELARNGLSRPGAPAAFPGRLLVVDAERQLATLIEGDEAVASWPVSTARAGIGGEAGSYRTPPGWHRISQRIGQDAVPGTVFVSREPTGETWSVTVGATTVGVLVGSTVNAVVVDTLAEIA